MTAWYVLIDGAREGPCEIATLDRMIREGRIDGATYVWTVGMADWANADNVPEIAALLRAAAEPLPPPEPPAPPEPAAPPPVATVAADEPVESPAPAHLRIGRAAGDAFRVLFESPVRTVLFGAVLYLALLACSPEAWALALFGPDALNPVAGPPGAFGVLIAAALVGFAILSVFWGGLCASALAMVRDRPARVALLFSGFPRMFSLIAFTILAGAACLAGAVALVLPGIFLFVCLALGPLAIVDRGAGPIAAFRESWRVVMRLGWFRCFAASLLWLVVTAVAFGLAAAALAADVALGAAETLGEDAARPFRLAGAELQLYLTGNPSLKTILLFNVANAVSYIFAAGLCAAGYEQGRAVLDSPRARGIRTA